MLFSKEIKQTKFKFDFLLSGVQLIWSNMMNYNKSPTNKRNNAVSGENNNIYVQLNGKLGSFSKFGLLLKKR
jgi:hypothetical protein